MPLVVLLRGVNVGGHRTFRPAALARELAHLDAINIGAAGTFVIGRPISRTALRAEVSERLPFDAEIMICDGRDVIRLMTRDHFAGQPGGPGVVRFVSVLSRAPTKATALPLVFRSNRTWMLKIVARDGPFVVGLYRRHMQAIRYLGTVDRIFGAPATTRNWNTIAAIAGAVQAIGARPRSST